MLESGVSTRSLALALLTLGACGDGGGGDEPIVGEAQVEVLHYDYSFDLETREATATLQLRVLEEGNCFALPARAPSLDALSLDGVPPEEASLADGSVRLCGEGWPVDATLEFQSSTVVPLDTVDGTQVGYSQSPDIDGQPFYYMVSWVGGCDQFAPCDSRPSAFATYRFVIDHPAGTEVLCPGTIDAGETQTICNFEHSGGPTYSTFGFAASPNWETHSLGNWSGVDVTLYDMATANIAGQIDSEEHASFFEWMIENFGPYAYGSDLRLAVGPTYWNGFEHPGNILLNDKLDTGGFGSSFSNPLAHTTSHELAHQWAGDQTTLADTYDFVWKEAMAEYLVFVHKEENISQARAKRTLFAWKQFSGFAEYYPVPAERPTLFEYYGDAYGPGPMVLFRQLEAIFSRDQVLQAIASLLGSERAVSIDDVQAALEESTGADLQNYFDTWVRGLGAPAWPSFRVDLTEVIDGIEVKVTQENADAGLWGCNFNVVLEGANEGEERVVFIDRGVDGRAEFIEVLDPGFEVVNTLVDPDHMCIARKATSGLQAPTLDPTFAEPWVAPDFKTRR